MAAGQGKRMQSAAADSRAKVLYPLDGKPLIGHVLNLCLRFQVDRVICIVGFGREQVSQYLIKEFPGVQIAIQDEQLGTGHAVQKAQRQLQDFQGDVLVLSGDVPLLSYETAHRLLETHYKKNARATVLTVRMSNPKGYGRIVRTDTGSLQKIVEEKDATLSERDINEINSGIYVFDADTLFEVLKHIDRRNAQGEYYLTDAFSHIISQFGFGSVAITMTDDPIEVSGINTKAQLEELEREYRSRSAAVRV